MVFLRVVSWLPFHVIIRRHLEFVFGVAFIERLLVVQNSLNRCSNIRIQLRNQKLFFFVFMDPLFHKAIALFNDLLVQLELLILAAE